MTSNLHLTAHEVSSLRELIDAKAETLFAKCEAARAMGRRDRADALQAALDFWQTLDRKLRDADV